MLEKVQPIRALILDVDGVLTDGKIIYSDQGGELKAFHVRDGHGIKMLLRQGIQVILVTGRTSAAASHRAQDLGIETVYQGVTDKVVAFETILKQKSLQPEQVAFIGDDVVDIPLLSRVGFSVAVADAMEEVKDCVDYVSRHGGGHGAVREVCDLILKSQGKWEASF